MLFFLELVSRLEGCKAVTCAKGSCFGCVGRSDGRFRDGDGIIGGSCLRCELRGGQGFVGIRVLRGEGGMMSGSGDLRVRPISKIAMRDGGVV